MTNAQITIGQCYLARVSGKLVPVRVVERFEYHAGRVGMRYGWKAVNTKTGRTIVVRSPQKFRSAVAEERPMTAAQERAEWLAVEAESRKREEAENARLAELFEDRPPADEHEDSGYQCGKGLRD
jgi:hypothetical protein